MYDQKCSVSSRSLEQRLQNHYARTRVADAQDKECKSMLAALMVKEAHCAENASIASDTTLSFAGFVAAQARFIPWWTWVAQGILITFAFMLGLFSASAPAAAAGSSFIGAATVLVGLPGILSSKSFGTAELEYACRFDCTSVVTARLIALGCSDALVLGCAALCMPLLAHLPFVENMIHLCFPFFLSTSGCLAIARRATSVNILPAAAGWTVFVMMFSCAFTGVVPALYGSISILMWALASFVAAVWTIREAYLLMRAAAQGLDVLCPNWTFSR